MKIFRSRREDPPEAGQVQIMPRLSAGTYIELVRSLFVTLVPASIMSICFVVVGGYAVTRTPDPILLICFGLGVVASIVRIAMLLILRGKAASETLDAKTAGWLERKFAPPYLGFAITFGAFSARAFAVTPASDHILLIGLIFGYGAGVAAGISLRPWISIPSILVAIVPTIVTSLFMPGVANWGTGILTAIFMAGGVESMLKRYQATSRQISMHRLLSTLGRLDDLTRLPNRLRLDEKFERIAAAPAAEPDLVAVHLLDLEGLGHVNETYGYPAGDALLKMITERLGGILADEDVAARLSGVEFAVVQPGLAQSRQAEILAQQMMIALAEPYAIGGGTISIGVRIGYAYDVQRDADLDYLLDGADQAVRKAAAESISIVCHNQRKWVATPEAGTAKI
jgi:diguanylate cyclase (GGDEF)-like protein